MSSHRFTPECKEEAVRQVVERGYSVSEVSARLGDSTHSLYKWVKAVTPDETEKQAADLLEAKSEILRLRAQMLRVEEERDILKKAARYFTWAPWQSTVSSTSIVTSFESQQCAGYCTWLEPGSTRGCTSRCLIATSKTNVCLA